MPCGCDRRCEKLLYWLGWRKKNYDGQVAWSYETPNVAVALPYEMVRDHHTRAAIVGIVVRALYGRNRFEGGPVPFWKADFVLSNEDTHKLYDAGLTIVRHAKEDVEHQLWTGKTWVAVQNWLPILRARKLLPVPSDVKPIVWKPKEVR